MKKEILMLAALLMLVACEMTLVPDQEATEERMTLYFTGENLIDRRMSRPIMILSRIPSSGARAENI